MLFQNYDSNTYRGFQTTGAYKKFTFQAGDKSLFFYKQTHSTSKTLRSSIDNLHKLKYTLAVLEKEKI